RHGFSAAPMHGDLVQAVRTETLAAFKAGTITYLVATDVAGRGLDIVGLSHVFNFDVPIHAGDYIHRIGRTGRAGTKGHAIMLATRADEKYLAAIQKLIRQDIPVLDGMDAIAAPGADQAPEKDGAKVRTETPKKPSRTRGRRGGAKAKTVPKTRTETEPQPKGGGRGRRSGARKEPARGQVIGLGDHVPAFLARDPKKSI
ncbi:MAG: C-terminal helicase domain-containing protein, partial [Alphaproteobacteria bacterium]|nr:C-terminal helicase domain-containing protein [Alphaproteobacteria bacterium]